MLSCIPEIVEMSNLIVVEHYITPSIWVPFGVAQDFVMAARVQSPHDSYSICGSED